MKPDKFCISYLAQNQFLRNPNVHHFVELSEEDLEENNLMWYCVGTIGDKRFVHTLQFLARTGKPGITSYFIRWYCTAPYSHYTIQEMPDNFDYVDFWVHSGVALRKNLFLFEDRLSLVRSTFCFHNRLKQFFRLSHVHPFLKIPERVPHNVPIYSSLIKKYYYQKKNSRVLVDRGDKKRKDLSRHLKKIVEIYNVGKYMEKEFPKLFQEMEIIISKNGNPS